MKSAPEPISALPRVRAFDSTLQLLREGYLFISRRADRLETDAFRTRLLLRPVVCARGAAAAEIFYGGDRFDRSRAMPVTVLKLLQGRGSVQQLEGAAHRARKRMFLSLMTPVSVSRLGELVAEEWFRRLDAWEARGEVVLLDEMRRILARAACRWAGVPLDATADRRTLELTEMVMGAGGFGPRTWRALVLRARSERWARWAIRRARAAAAGVGDDPAPIQIIAAHRDHDGRALSEAAAAVELLNLLRPTVAVAHFIVFAAAALSSNADSLHRVREGDLDHLDRLVQEVRRQAPLFPFVGGRARVAFDWRGVRFPRRTWFLLDLYGTNNDPRSWPDPGRFAPDRFIGRTPTPFDYVPQGGGDHLTGHRCPGEWSTIALTKRAVRMLATAIDYDVPPQDLSLDLTRIPALPRSGFRISNVRRRPRPAVFTGPLEAAV